MKKTYVVIGLGRFGTAIASRLYALGNEVLAIDTDAAKVQHAEPFVTYAVIGDARDEEVLKSLGVKNYDCAVVAIGKDLATSVIVTLNLKDLNIPVVICKATDEIQKKALEKVGADRVVVPEREMGVKLAQALTSSSVLDFIELSSDYGIAEVAVPENGSGKRCGSSTCGQNTAPISSPSAWCVDQRHAGRRPSAQERKRACGRRAQRAAFGASEMRREIVTSAHNPLLTHLKKLLSSRSYREKCGEFAADGTKLLEEAARWYPGLETVVVQQGVELCALPEHVRVVEIPEI